MSTLTDDRPTQEDPCEVAGCTATARLTAWIYGIERRLCLDHARQADDLPLGGFRQPKSVPYGPDAERRDSQWQAGYDSWLDKREAMGR